MSLICFEGGARGIYESDLTQPLLPAAMIYDTTGQIKATESAGLLQSDKASGWKEIQPPAEEIDPLQELIDWTEGRSIAEYRSSGRQARYTMEIMMAIYESLSVKNVVKMLLKTRESPLELMVEDGTLPVLKPGRYDLRKPFPEQQK